MPASRHYLDIRAMRSIPFMNILTLATMKIKLPIPLNKVFMTLIGLYLVYFTASHAGQPGSDLAILILDVTVSGTVTDTEGEPVRGATVSVPGTTLGTATDLNGRYALTVPEGSTLVFSFIGFETQSIPIGGRNVMDVALAEDMASLDEIVVVGYGAQRKSDLTGAV